MLTLIKYKCFMVPIELLWCSPSAQRKNLKTKLNLRCMTYLFGDRYQLMGGVSQGCVLSPNIYYII